jgi:hypothetical protein
MSTQCDQQLACRHGATMPEMTMLEAARGESRVVTLIAESIRNAGTRAVPMKVPWPESCTAHADLRS